jgi:hypothetical protein
MKNTARRPRLLVSADGAGIVSHAGGVLVTRTARVTGLDGGLWAGLARVIRTVAQAGAAVVAIEAIAVLAGLLALGWLPAFGLLLMGMLSIWGSAKNQPARTQGSRLTAAILLDIAAVWTGAVAGAGVGVEWALPAAGLALAAVFAGLGSAQPAAGRTGRGEGR